MSQSEKHLLIALFKFDVMESKSKVQYILQLSCFVFYLNLEVGVDVRKKLMVLCLIINSKGFLIRQRELIEGGGSFI